MYTASSCTVGRYGVLFIAFASAKAGVAAQLLVPDDFATIQAAVDAAESRDVIRVSAGTYFETVDLLGKSIRVSSISGADATIIDAGGAGTVLTGAADGTQIAGFTLRNGDAFDGGGMRNDAASPSITGCIFEGNTATFGGGMANRNGASPLVLRCTFVANDANFGGGMYNREGAAPIVLDCEFEENFALTGTGGGMFNLGAAPVVIDSAFVGNRSLTRSGGGMVLFDSAAEISNCNFIDNEADDDGGAILIDGSDPCVTSCTFNGNAAQFGGAIANDGASPLVMNGLFVGNTSQYGGAVFSFDSLMRLVNCSLIGNTASNEGGGLRSLNSGSEVVNSILWSNVPDQVSDFQGTTVVSMSNVEGGWSRGGRGNINSDPSFVNPMAGNYRLLPGSPSLDAGDTESLPSDDCDVDGNGDRGEPTPLDLDGAARVIGPYVDQGAFESQDLIECPADFNGDGTVNFDDLMVLLFDWGACEEECPTDLDGTGFVDGFDLFYFVLSWGDCG